MPRLMPRPSLPEGMPLTVLESGGESRNSQGVIGAAHAELVLRPTGLQVLQQCAELWRRKFIVEVQEVDTLASRIGTMVHEVVEAYMKGTFELNTPRWREIEARLVEAGVPPAEVVNLEGYLFPLANWRPYVLALEHEFLLTLIQGAPPICGHLDLVIQREPGLVTIIDHKTNRQAKPEAWWRERPQVILYSWAARQLWPGQRHLFRIGYVNLPGRSLTWDIEPAVDEQARALLQAAWVTLRGHLALPASGTWPATPGDHCRNCPVREACPERTARNQALMTSVGLSADGEWMG